MLNDIKNVSNKVEYLLEKYPETRSCDKLLWLGFMTIFNNLKNEINSNNNSYSILRKIILNKNTPSFESLSRARRKIQENNNLLIGNNIKERQIECENVKHWSLEK